MAMPDPPGSKLVGWPEASRAIASTRSVTPKSTPVSTIPIVIPVPL